MNQVKPYSLWIGHAGDGRAIRQIHDHKIRVIVQLAMEEPPIKATRDIVLLRYPLVDGLGNASDLLSLTINSVVALIRARIPTLVCCGGGMSRSPAIVAAALAIISERSFDASLKSLLEFLPADVSASLLQEVSAVVDRMR